MYNFRRMLQICCPWPWNVDTSCLDPVRKRPVCGSGRETNPEADDWLGAGHAVLFSAHQQSQQRRRSAAPRHRHHRPGPPENPTRRGGKDQCRRHGDCAAAHRADNGKSQVITADAIQQNGTWWGVKQPESLNVPPAFVFRRHPVRWIYRFLQLLLPIYWSIRRDFSELAAKQGCELPQQA